MMIGLGNAQSANHASGVKRPPKDERLREETRRVIQPPQTMIRAGQILYGVLNIGRINADGVKRQRNSREFAGARYQQCYYASEFA